MEHPTLEQTVIDLLTENTGRHFLDSGGNIGRNWQRNQGMTVAVMEDAPSAKLEVYHREGYGYELSPTVSLYHYLTDRLYLDDHCDEFNALPVEDWDGGYGISEAGLEWLTERGFELGETHNSYNYESTLSQVIQWTVAEYDGQAYALLQVHGGADVRGGYTDAKLFALEDEYDFYGTADCGFSVETEDGGYLSLSYHGEWITEEGSAADEADIADFCRRLLEDDSDSATTFGDMY